MNYQVSSSWYKMEMDIPHDDRKKMFLEKLVYCSVLCLCGEKWLEVFWLTVYSSTPPYAK